MKRSIKKNDKNNCENCRLFSDKNYKHDDRMSAVGFCQKFTEVVFKNDVCKQFTDIVQKPTLSETQTIEQINRLNTLFDQL